jgi:hypothetical protein
LEKDEAVGEYFIVIIVVILGIWVLFLFYNFVKEVYDSIYSHFFNRIPVSRFALRLRKLSLADSAILQQTFPYYNRLTHKQQLFFNHRVIIFLEHYRIHGRDITVTKEMALTISGTYVMLTFGFREFLSKSFQNIIVYPSAYPSSVSDDFHKGEFNPATKSVVFSWEDFILGHEIENDNLNLGIHEFTHVLHFDSKRFQNANARLFKKHFNQILALLTQEEYRQKVEDAALFRAYSKTNEFEFLAVLVEHFFESPVNLKTQLPDLYFAVERLLNYERS